MKHCWILCICLLTACVDSPADSEDFENASAASIFLAEINTLRQKGCYCGNQWMPPAPPLEWDILLEAAAERHAYDMAQHDHFGHNGTDGSDVSDRINGTGYRWGKIAENIAYGYDSIALVVKGWKDSPSHCENMMDSTFTEMGAASANEYWVQTLAKPR